ncbi:hypothetical protein [Olleya sp. R77988]|uniref:hypothetical protein n=1 Tax=Olleya sp. R77988 TaxID=3093875 RepID=UPI0037CA24CC
MKKEGYLNRKNAIYLALISAFSLISVALINNSCESNEPVKETKEVIFDGSEAEENNVTINKQEAQTNNGIIIGTQNNNNTTLNKVEKDVSGYYFLGSSELLTQIRKKKLVKINVDAKNTFKLSHSNNLRRYNENSNNYQYRGGYVILYFNDNICHEFNDLIIDEIPINTKSKINKIINDKINQIVKLNMQQFENAILDCI